MQGKKKELLEYPLDIATDLPSNTLAFSVLKTDHPITIIVTTDTQVGDLTFSLQVGEDDGTFAYVADPSNTTSVYALTMAAAWAYDSKAFAISEVTSGAYYRFVVSGGTSGTITSIVAIS